MLKQIDYKILTSQSTEDLEKQVREYLNEGWEVDETLHIGSFHDGPEFFYQVMGKWREVGSQRKTPQKKTFGQKIKELLW